VRIFEHGHAFRDFFALHLILLIVIVISSLNLISQPLRRDRNRTGSVRYRRHQQGGKDEVLQEISTYIHDSISTYPVRALRTRGRSSFVSLSSIMIPPLIYMPVLLPSQPPPADAETKQTKKEKRSQTNSQKEAEQSGIHTSAALRVRSPSMTTFFAGGMSHRQSHQKQTSKVCW
jgi:hypothetical protein